MDMKYYGHCNNFKKTRQTFLTIHVLIYANLVAQLQQRPLHRIPDTQNHELKANHYNFITWKLSIMVDMVIWDPVAVIVNHYDANLSTFLHKNMVICLD